MPAPVVRNLDPNTRTPVHIEVERPQGESTAVRHGVNTVHDQIDEDLLQFGSIHPDEASCAVFPLDGNRRLLQQMLNKRQRVRDNVRNGMLLHIACILLRLGETAAAW